MDPSSPRVNSMIPKLFGVSQELRYDSDKDLTFTMMAHLSDFQYLRQNYASACGGRLFYSMDEVPSFRAQELRF